jgi:hypothetical protein
MMNINAGITAPDGIRLRNDNYKYSDTSYIYDRYYDNSTNLSGANIAAELDARSPDPNNPSWQLLDIENWNRVYRYVYANEIIRGYDGEASHDYSENSAWMNIRNGSLYTDFGNIDIYADNYLYSYIWVQPTEICNGALNGFEDGSQNYASINIDAGGLIATDGSLYIEANNTVDKNLDVYTIAGDYIDDSNNYGRIDLANITFDVAGSSRLTAEEINFNSGASWALQNTLTVDGNLYLFEGSTLTLGANTLELTGDLHNHNILDTQTGTVSFTGDTSIFGAIPVFHNVNITGTLRAPLDNTIYVAADWTNYGFFEHNNSNVIFIDNPDTQELDITHIYGNTIFGSFTCTVPEKHFIFQAGSTQTIDGVMTLNGGERGTEIVLDSDMPYDGTGDPLASRFSLIISNLVPPDDDRQTVYYVRVYNSQIDAPGFDLFARYSIGAKLYDEFSRPHNNDNREPARPRWIFGIDIKNGTIYDRATGLPLDANIKMWVTVYDGTMITWLEPAYTYTYTPETGNFTLEGVPVDTDQQVLIFLEDETYEANWVTLAKDVVTDIIGPIMYTNTITLRTESGTPISNAFLTEISTIRDLDQSLRLDLQDEVHFSVIDGDAFFNDGLDVWIPAGHAFVPEGEATFTGGLLNEGTFDPEQNLVTFNGSGTFDITTGTTVFDELLFDNSLGNWNIKDALNASVITINDAHDFTAESTVNAESFTQLDGNGTTTFDDTVALTDTMDITTNAIAVNGAVSAANDISLVADTNVILRNRIETTDTGSLVVNAGRDIFYDGAFANGEYIETIGGVELTAVGSIILGSSPVTYGTSYGYGDVYSWGDIILNAGGDIIVDYWSEIYGYDSAKVSLAADGDIRILDNPATPASSVNSDYGNIDIIAGNDIYVDNNSWIESYYTGTVTLEAGNNITLGYVGSEGTINITADSDNQNGGVLELGTITTYHLAPVNLNAEAIRDTDSNGYIRATTLTMTTHGQDGDIGQSARPLYIRTDTNLVNAAASGTGEIALTTRDSSGNLGTGTIYCGTITGATGAITINGNLTLSTANARFDAALSASVNLLRDLNIAANTTVIAPAGNLYIGDDFRQTGGTFTHNNGTVIFDGDGDWNQELTTDGDSFNNLVLNTNNATLWFDNLELMSTLLNIDGDLRIEKGGFEINSTTSSPATVNVGKNVTISSGQAVLNAGGTDAGITINVGASWTNNGNQAVGGSSCEDGFEEGNSIVRFNSRNTGNTVTSGLSNFYDVRFNSANGLGAWALLDNLHALYNLGVYSGSLDASTVTVDTDLDFSMTGGTFKAPAGILYVGDDFWQTGGTFTHNNGTVIFDGNANNFYQTITTDGDAFFNLTLNTTNAVDYANLELLSSALNIDNNLTILNGGFELSADSVVTIGQDVIIDSGACGLDADDGGIIIKVGGNWTNNGNQTLPRGGPSDGFDEDSSTVIFTSGATDRTITSGKSSFYNIGFNGSGSWALQDSLTVTNDLTINKGTLDSNYKKIDLVGDWMNNGGTFNATTSTVTLLGIGLQQVKTGGSASAFNKLVITNPSSDGIAFVDSLYAGIVHAKYNEGGVKKLSFAAGVEHVISGNLIINGAAGNLIILCSLTGSSWQIRIPNNRDISFVDVSNSENTGNDYVFKVKERTPASCVWEGNSHDGGNNINWFAPKPPDPPEQTGGSPIQPPKLKEPTGRENIALGEAPVSIPEEGEYRRYSKAHYLAGKYRTVVIVFEGRIVVSPYDEEGTKEDKAETLTTGQKASQEAEVK